jgi:hypothetical protein
VIGRKEGRKKERNIGVPRRRRKVGGLYVFLSSSLLSRFLSHANLGGVKKTRYSDVNERGGYAIS